MAWFLFIYAVHLVNGGFKAVTHFFASQEHNHSPKCYFISSGFTASMKPTPWSSLNFTLHREVVISFDLHKENETWI